MTNKIQYSDAFEACAKIVLNFSQANRKANVKMDSLGLIIYLAYDNEAKEISKAEETE